MSIVLNKTKSTAQVGDKQPRTKKQIITWLELAMSVVSPQWRKAEAEVVVRPVDMDQGVARWGITQEGRWLCGGDGLLTVFDSLAAASRFLDLLKVDRFTLGDPCDGDAWVCEQDDFQCFRLAQRRLAACNSAPRSNNVTRASDARMIDAWSDSQAVVL